MLTQKQQQLWSDYLAMEDRGTRDAKLRALESFITLVRQSPIAEWEPWAFDVAERVVDHRERIPVRMPLFRTLIFPALLNGRQRCVASCARWLAGLSQQLYQCRECQTQLPANEQTELGLLETAVRLDPTDRNSASRLIDAFANRLQFTLHELPAGVLYGMNGATPDECIELQAELQDFISLVERHGQVERFSSLIDNCQLHYHEYREYLMRGADFPSYAAYLAESAAEN